MTLFETDVQRLKELLREQPRPADAPSREALKQVDLRTFWGSRIWVATDDNGGLLWPDTPEDVFTLTGGKLHYDR